MRRISAFVVSTLVVTLQPWIKAEAFFQEGAQAFQNSLLENLIFLTDSILDGVDSALPPWVPKGRDVLASYFPGNPYDAKTFPTFPWCSVTSTALGLGTIALQYAGMSKAQELYHQDRVMASIAWNTLTMVGTSPGMYITSCGFSRDISQFREANARGSEDFPHQDIAVTCALPPHIEQGRAKKHLQCAAHVME